MQAKDLKRIKRQKRIRARVSGTSTTPRLRVFRSNKFIYAQLIDDVESKTILGTSDTKATKGTKTDRAKTVGLEQRCKTQLSQWPVQLRLVPVRAPYFADADLLIAADCVPFAYANFYQDLLRGKILLVGCPKLDELSLYADKLKQVIADNNIKSITYAHMEVPCCFGLLPIIKEAISRSGKKIPFEDITVTIKGEKA